MIKGVIRRSDKGDKQLIFLFYYRENDRETINMLWNRPHITIKITRRTTGARGCHFLASFSKYQVACKSLQYQISSIQLRILGLYQIEIIRLQVTDCEVTSMK